MQGIKVARMLSWVNPGACNEGREVVAVYPNRQGCFA